MRGFISLDERTLFIARSIVFVGWAGVDPLYGVLPWTRALRKELLSVLFTKVCANAIFSLTGNKLLVLTMVSLHRSIEGLVEAVDCELSVDCSKMPN